MSDYTPTEVGVRLAYVGGLSESGFSREEHRAEFDRFIAQIKADAWDEGHTEGSVSLGIAVLHGKGYEGPSNPYRKATDE